MLEFLPQLVLNVNYTFCMHIVLNLSINSEFVVFDHFWVLGNSPFIVFCMIGLCGFWIFSCYLIWAYLVEFFSAITWL